MKKLFILLFALVASVSAIYASDKQVDGIWYDFSGYDHTATVTYRGSYYDSYHAYSGSVVIPSSVTYNGTTYRVTSIRSYAFSGCSSLTSITIPNSVTSIGDYAFDGCSSLTSVTINSDAIVNKAYTDSDNLSDIFGSQVTKYIIGDNVKGIGEYAFSGCSSLTSITIPNSVTSIGDYAFKGCSSLTSPVYNAHCFACMPSSYSGAYAIPEGIKQIAGSAFCNCSSLTSITIPNSVKSIGLAAFYGCYSLTSVTILDRVTSFGNSVTSIGKYAFGNCSSLTSVTIGNSVTSIGEGAFKECSSLTSVTINSDAIVNKAYTDSDNLSDIFGSQVTKYIIGDNIKGIGDYAFYECSSLTSVTIGNSVTSIGEMAFGRCKSLTSITIPNSVTSIGEQAFQDCYFLTSITIPNSVTSIGKYAFNNCKSLTSVTIPNSVTSIGDGAFKSCSSLTSVTIPNSVTSIGDWAFYNCESLTSITIPNSVTSIGDFAFYECSSLTSITCEAMTPPTVGSSAFYGVSKSIPVHVPCGCVEAYKAAYGWKDFTNIQGPLAEYSITVGVNATKMGTAKVDINNACGTQISAKPNIGYHFVQWSDGVVNNPRSIVLTQDTVLIAEFAEIPSYVVEVIYNPDHGTVNGQGTYKEDEKVTLIATANDGYKFHKWSNGVTDNPYTFIVKSDVTLEAKFTSTEGIEDVQSDEVHTTKVIRDGQVLILRNGKTYTMQGQEVK